jgi:glycosyltransferase involved in cell wall biosynthesis
MKLMSVSKSIDAFIAHTNLEKDWLITNGIYGGKVQVVRFPAIPSTIIECRLCSERLSDIVYLGRIVHRKGLDIFVKALYEVKKSFSELRITIAGPSDPQYLSRLMKLVKQLRLESEVTFKGLVPEKEKYKVIQSHKILVLPSRKEYTPNILLEAQALGVPVIATRVGAVPEMMMDGETGILVEPNNVQELAKAIETLLNNDALRMGFSRKARKFAYNFTVERSAEKLEELYRRLLNESRR